MSAYDPKRTFSALFDPPDVACKAAKLPPRSATAMRQNRGNADWLAREQADSLCSLCEEVE